MTISATLSRLYPISETVDTFIQNTYESPINRIQAAKQYHAKKIHLLRLLP